MRQTSLIITLVVLAPWIARGTDAEFFEKRVRPVLHEHCVECHGPKKQKAGLRLDSRGALWQGREMQAFLADTSPDDSEAAAQHIPKSPKNSIVSVSCIRI